MTFSTFVMTVLTGLTTAMLLFLVASG